MKPLRVLEGVLLGTGVVLLGFWGVMSVHRSVGEKADLSRFAEAREAARTAPAPAAEAARPTAAADMSLWSPERVRAYEESLRKEFGAPLGILSIPKIGLEVPLLDGTDDLTLNRAVGRIEETARPGEAGNLGIAGHRDGFFRGLKDVAVGDEIRLKTLTRDYLYLIESIRIVSPEDVHVLDATPKPVLTLVSCYPFYFVGSAPRRYIVRAVLVGDAPADVRSEASRGTPNP